MQPSSGTSQPALPQSLTSENATDRISSPVPRDSTKKSHEKNGLPVPVLDVIAGDQCVGQTGAQGLIAEKLVQQGFQPFVQGKRIKILLEEGFAVFEYS
jgi:hypothetical protein